MPLNTVDDIFSHSTPIVFNNEAPTNSTSIAERILDRGFDIADEVIRAKYGDKAAIPASADPRTAAGRAALQAQQMQAAQSGNIGLIAVVVLILLLIFRR